LGLEHGRDAGGRLARPSRPYGYAVDAATITDLAFLAQLQWYHWLQATERGARVRKNHNGLPGSCAKNGRRGAGSTMRHSRECRHPSTIPDWVDVTLHSYRARWGAEPDPASRWLDDKVDATKTLFLPTIYFEGELDGVNPPKAS
jgi:hypothetical protein